MNLQMTFKHIQPNEKVKSYAQEKSEKLNKYFDGKISVSWNFTFERDTAVAHCHVVGKNIDYFGECEAETLPASIDLVIEKIERQVRKHKEMVRDHLHSANHEKPPVTEE
ncbi:MAG: ribosome-associated translation inhibitor RaiA [Pseudomonadota bacterium]|jgi:putative sigma-54 modulation protein